MKLLFQFVSYELDHEIVSLLQIPHIPQMLKYTTLKGFKLEIDMVQLMFKKDYFAVDWTGGGQDQEPTAMGDDGEWTKVVAVEMERDRFERYLELKGLGVVA